MPISFTSLTQRKRPTCYLYSACLDDTQRLVTVNYFFFVFLLLLLLAYCSKFTLTTSSFHFLLFSVESAVSTRQLRKSLCTSLCTSLRQLRNISHSTQHIKIIGILTIIGFMEVKDTFLDCHGHLTWHLPIDYQLKYLTSRLTNEVSTVELQVELPVVVI